MRRRLPALRASSMPGRSFLHAALFAAVLVCPIASCGDGRGAGSSTEYPVVERDSAGIRIVEHARVPPLGHGGWIVEAEPVVSIGGFYADEDHQLFRIRGARVLSNGSIAVANAGSAEIRFFSPTGQLLGAAGGRGGGPGEYQSPAIVGLTPGDTLVIGDFQNNRVSFVHPESGFVRSFVANPDGSFGFARGTLADGRILMGGGVAFGGGAEIEEGLTRQGTEFHLADGEGAPVGDLGEFPGPELVVSVASSGGGSLISARSLPFSRNTEAAAGGDAVYIGASDSFEILRFNPRGELVQILRNGTPPPAVTREHLDHYARLEVEEAEEGDRARILREWSDIDPPATFPAFQDLVVDRAGYLWVQDFALPGEEGSAWSVFDPAGHVAARVTTPDDFTVLEIGEDYVLGVLRDELDTEILQLLPLRRGSPEG